MIHITIPGEPIGQARPRVTRWGTYDPPKSKAYKNLVKRYALHDYSGEPLTKPVFVGMRIYRPIQKSGSKKLHAQKESGAIRPAVKPDIDNVFKAVTDAMTGIVWVDDNQIVETRISKFYSTDPRVEVEIKEIKS
ncbi:RusA family crossover junction endodeoxyribonuclease [Lacticaseibacillus zhaodongensis]|uniref:RusA family crossover junction endodeoxyribonuclease n=1 Tax=Lacticaseibacillus zhaodongensis TaxID=2668065 RepID=UPI0012D30504|nr:RusA family crossover junction endodeoxyribonuclease [Lacticaseibacillus zhaodongensis]